MAKFKHLNKAHSKKLTVEDLKEIKRVKRGSGCLRRKSK
jgi:hypothetical protein